jgi:hypothetical protein
MTKRELQRAERMLHHSRYNVRVPLKQSPQPGPFNPARVSSRESLWLLQCASALLVCPSGGKDCGLFQWGCPVDSRREAGVRQNLMVVEAATKPLAARGNLRLGHTAQVQRSPCKPL